MWWMKYNPERGCPRSWIDAIVGTWFLVVLVSVLFVMFVKC